MQIVKQQITYTRYTELKYTLTSRKDSIIC